MSRGYTEWVITPPGSISSWRVLYFYYSADESELPERTHAELDLIRQKEVEDLFAMEKPEIAFSRLEKE
ncbi:hypothetical protein MTBBW1_2280003 [Desulfamplus magnetovallimortis]|uniref:Uncharacterized protein n=1 Tax=Desulfamplus magnetovallimortis TaxID=1246637 RepID=A0A1W1HD83_9BACT|nr:hypothetical protein MTBBW1_2280003 [Desulfamplus magnetovallimortis]